MVLILSYVGIKIPGYFNLGKWIAPWKKPPGELLNDYELSNYQNPATQDFVTFRVIDLFNIHRKLKLHST
jgi:hypothetical protein